jgi:hypothetical protein
VVAQLAAKHLHQEHGSRCTAAAFTQTQRQTTPGCGLVYVPLDANGDRKAFYDCLSVLHALFYADVLLVLRVA